MTFPILLILIVCGGLAGWLLVRRHEDRVRQEVEAEWRASHSRAADEDRAMDAQRDPYLEAVMAEIKADPEKNRPRPRSRTGACARGLGDREASGGLALRFARRPGRIRFAGARVLDAFRLAFSQAPKTGISSTNRPHKDDGIQISSS